MKKQIILIVTLLIFVATKPLLGATYVYTANNFETHSNPSGYQVTPMNISSSLVDTVIIQGSGFGNRNLNDSWPESVYVANPTVGNELWQIYRGQYDNGGTIYFGLMSWTDNEIQMEVRGGFGGSLGDFIQLRAYPGPGGQQSSSVRGDLTLIPEPSTSLILSLFPVLILFLRKR
jgi:hypothetical protein